MTIAWWQALILGVVQGLSEFLPISSSGHLVLFQNILGVKGEVLLFDTLLHGGTLVAVVAALWPDVWALLRRPWQRVTGLLILATIPAVIVTLLWSDAIEKAFGGAYLAWGFMLTAVVLLSTALFKGRKEPVKLEKISLGQSVAVGLSQAAAILPGVSRSGSTIAAGLFSGVERESATRFSFLLSIPAVLGALVFHLKDLAGGAAAQVVTMSGGAIAVGVIAAMVSGYVALKWMLRLVKGGKLWVFGLYTGLLGILVLCDQLWFHLITWG